MFKWLFLKFADGYNSSMMGEFLYNVQVGLRNSWDRSWIGMAVYGENRTPPSSPEAMPPPLNRGGQPTSKPPLLRGGAEQSEAEGFAFSKVAGLLRGFASRNDVLKKSLIFKLLAKTEIYFAAVLAVAPIAPTMICAGLSVLALGSLFVKRVIFEGHHPASCGGTPPQEGNWGVLSWAVLAFLVLTFIYSLTSLDIIGSLKIWAIYAVFISMFFVAREVIKTKRDRGIACWILASVGGLVATYGVYQNFFGNMLGHAWLDEEMFTSISVRVYSTLGNPNVLGEYLLLTIPVTVGLLWNQITNNVNFTKVKFWIKALVLFGLAGAQFLCMIYTQSRGCWIALAFSALIFILFVDKRWIALFLVALIAAPFILPQSMMDRLLSIGNMSDSSTSYRVNIWMGTLNMLEHFWLTGVGLGAAAFAKVYPFYSYSMITAPHAHNIYLETMAEMGIVGLGILVLIVGAFVFGVLRVIARANGSKQSSDLALRNENFSKKNSIAVAPTFGKDTGLPRPPSRHAYARGRRPRNDVIMAVAFMAGILGFMLQGAFDYVWYNYRVFLLFWMFIGIGSKICEPKTDIDEL